MSSGKQSGSSWSSDLVKPTGCARANGGPMTVFAKWKLWRVSDEQWSASLGGWGKGSRVWGVRMRLLGARPCAPRPGYSRSLAIPSFRWSGGAFGPVVDVPGAHRCTSKLEISGLRRIGRPSNASVGGLGGVRRVGKLVPEKFSRYLKWDGVRYLRRG